MTIARMRKLQQSAGPRPADLLFAVALVGLTQGEIWVLTLGADQIVPTVRVAASLLTLAAAGSLALRRTSPLVCYWINTAAVWGTIAAGYPSDFYQWTNLVALYSIAARGSSHAAAVALPASVGGVVFYFVRFPFEGDPPLAAFVVAVWVVAWLAGRMYGSRMEQAQLRAERDVARQLADANEERLAHEEERNRIARELHDIIGHTVNVMVVHAGAGRRAAGSDPGTVRQAFDTIEQTGRSALSELDRVLAVLRRDDPVQERPTPGLGDLDDLAKTFTDTGLRVEVDVSGDPAGVPASVALAAYRIVQEALTNTLKHAAARTASVQVALAARHLDVRIADDGTGEVSTLQPGRGIRGMTERAALHGGTVSIDRDGDRGLVVTAHLTWEPSS